MARILLSAISAHSGGAQAYLRHLLPYFPEQQQHSLDILGALPPPIPLGHPNISWIRAPRWTLNPLWRFLGAKLYFNFFFRFPQKYDGVFFVAGSPDLSDSTAANTVITYHNANLFNGGERLHPWGFDRIRLWLLASASRKVFRTAALIIFISNYGKDLVDRAVPIRRGRSVVIHHGVVNSGDRLDARFANRLDRPFVLYISPFYDPKGHIELFRAWARLKQLRAGPEQLVLAGGGDNGKYFRHVKATVEELGLQNEVVFLGAIPHSQITDLVRRAVLNVFPSFSENCPTTMLEIMRAHGPLIASNIGPMPEIGGPGLEYVDPRDPEAFARLMLVYLSDQSLRERNARAGYERSLQFDLGDVGTRTWSAIIEAVEPTNPV